MKPIPNLLSWTGWLILSIAAGTLSAQQVTTDLPGEQIDLWVRQLGADAFATRQQATRQLMDAGVGVLPPLQAAIAGGEPETQMRAVAVIGGLAISEDADCQQQAQSLLAQLSTSSDPTLRQLVLQTIRRLGETMQLRAIDNLRRMGANVTAKEILDGLRTSRSFEIVIDESFQGSVDDFGSLTWLEGQTQLTLIGEKMDDAIVERISGMPSLYWLTVKRGRISNRCLATLADSPALRFLHLYYVDIDDRSLDALTKMQGLSQLRLFGTRMSQQTSLVAAERMPNTAVDWRNGAFLGIYFDDSDGPCIVNNVVKASAADRAGFQKGDQVLSFADKPVQTGQQFLRAVADYSPGDKVKAAVLREGQELELQMQLGRFPDREEFKENQ